MGNARWASHFMLEADEYDPDATPDLSTMLETPVKDGWKVVSMDADLYHLWSAVAHKGFPALVHVLTALADPTAADFTLTVTRANVVVDGHLAPVERAR